MIGDVPKLLAFLVCSLFAIADSAAARLQSTTGQPQVSGSARLTVRVVADDNGRPVKRASVNVLLLPDSRERVDQRRSHVSRRVETDNNGRSEIANLRPGTYSVSVDERSHAAGFRRFLFVPPILMVSLLARKRR
jgi:protocatechuate 3,4-dioxygenase beta subunit